MGDHPVRKGALVGTLTGLAVNLVVGVGARFVPPANIPLHPVSTEGCIASSNLTDAPQLFNSTKASENYKPWAITMVSASLFIAIIIKYILILLYKLFSLFSQGFTAFLSLSYTWYPLLGAVVCIVVGCFVSFIVSKFVILREFVAILYCNKWITYLS